MRGSSGGPAIVWREYWKEASRCTIQVARYVALNDPLVCCSKEHSVILTPFEVAVDGVQIPDRRYRYTWRSEVPTSHCRCTRTTMPQSA